MSRFSFPFAFGFALAFGMNAGAQEPAAGGAAGGTGGNASNAAGGVAPAGDSSANIAFSNAANLTPDEQVKQGDKIVAHIGSTVANVGAAVQKAQTERDPVKMVCLEDKQTQLVTTQDAAKDRFTSLKADVGRGDAEGATHDYRMLLVLGQNTDSLSAESNACVGDEVSYQGEGDVKTTIDSDIADNSAINGNVGENAMANPPQCVSCTL